MTDDTLITLLVCGLYPTIGSLAYIIHVNSNRITALETAHHINHPNQESS